MTTSIKANIPLFIYIGKVLLEKIGRKGARLNASLVREDGKWISHVHVTEYSKPCQCLKCQPIVKGLNA